MHTGEGPCRALEILNLRASALLRARGQVRKYLNFSTITEIPGRDSHFDQKLILAAGGQLNGGDGMRGRRDLGGRWPACSNALHIGTYMNAQRMVWTLQ